MKFIVVTGGIISGLGKGITSSSIGLLLKSRGINVTAIKIDPYLNVDAGTMSPFEHGECYVLADGGESDLDLGNYERFLDLNLTKDHNITTGKIYQNVINKERQGDYLGKTVQIIPHITNEIQNCIRKAAKIPVSDDKELPEVCLIEVGGTIGDIETAPFIEAIRQMWLNGGDGDHENQFCFVHVSMIVYNGEPKTKPTQHSVTALRTLGICPHLLVVRTPDMLTEQQINKLNTFCQVKKENIISNIDVKNIYYVPLIFKQQNICDKISKILNLKLLSKYNLTRYQNIINHFNNQDKKQKINLVIAGKYTGSQDTYLSLIRAIEHASFDLDVQVNVEFLNTEIYNTHQEIDTWFNDKQIHGFIIPGGFGGRGIQGKIKVATYARQKQIPILGICLGMQIMVVEYMQHLGYSDAASTEWNQSTEYPVIAILPDQTGILGGTMRLGDYQTALDVKSRTHTLYDSQEITERHRHRYEVNNKYVKILQDNDLHFVGTSKSMNGVELMEITELDKNKHSFYVGCQFHPEYRSRYDKPHPLFVGLIKSAIEDKN